MNPIIESLKVIIELLRTGFTNVSISAELDDPNIATIKDAVTNIATVTTATGTAVGNIYTLLDDRLVKKLWITRADYDQLVLDDEVDPETLYIVIESQSNPSNP